MARVQHRLLFVQVVCSISNQLSSWTVVYYSGHIHYNLCSVQQHVAVSDALVMTQGQQACAGSIAGLSCCSFAAVVRVGVLVVPVCLPLFGSGGVKGSAGSAE